MVDPEPDVGPVILPVIAPTVQENKLGTVAVKLMFVGAPLHTVTAPEFVSAGSGRTDAVIE